MPGTRRHLGKGKEKGKEEAVPEEGNDGPIVPNIKKIKERKEEIRKSRVRKIEKEIEKRLKERLEEEEENREDEEPSTAQDPPTAEPQARPARRKRTNVQGTMKRQDGKMAFLIEDLHQRDILVLSFLAEYLYDHGLIPVKHPAMVFKYGVNYLFKNVKREIESST